MVEFTSSPTQIYTLGYLSIGSDSPEADPEMRIPVGVISWESAPRGDQKSRGKQDRESREAKEQGWDFRRSLSFIIIPVCSFRV